MRLPAQTSRTLVVLGTVGALALACGSAPTSTPPAPGRPSSTPAPATTRAPASPAPPTGSFSGALLRSSFWVQDVRAAPVAADSAALVRDLARQVTSRYGGTAALNVWSSNASLWTASAATPRVTVGFDNCQGKTGVPAGLFGAGGMFTDVPVPAGAQPAAGSDADLDLWSPSTDQLWEFWKARHDQAGWHACWGGRLDHVSTGPGYFPGSFGASASGLASAAGIVTIAEARAGVIRHALEIAVPTPREHTVVSWPAQRSDGFSTDPDAPAEGQRYRLDPTLDVDALGLSPLAAMIARAAQTYGIVVGDKAGAVEFSVESGAPTRERTGTDPWTALLGAGHSYDVLRGFPWDRLQALPQNYGRPG